MAKQEVFKKRVYKELDRINKLYISLNGKDSILPVSFFNENVVMGASAKSIKEKIGLNFNDLKKARGLPIQRGRFKGEKVIKGYLRKGNIGLPVKRTKRNCNMRDEYHGGRDKWFMAESNMFSCPSCTNLKKHSEAFSGGLDEAGLGTLGGINR